MGSISPAGAVAVVAVELGCRVRRRAEPQATASARASGRRVDVRLRLPRRGAYLGGKSRGARTPAELARAFVAAELMRRVRRRAEPRASASVSASGHRVACASGCRVLSSPRSSRAVSAAEPSLGPPVCARLWLRAGAGAGEEEDGPDASAGGRSGRREAEMGRGVDGQAGQREALGGGGSGRGGGGGGRVEVGPTCH